MGGTCSAHLVDEICTQNFSRITWMKETIYNT